MLDFLLVLGQIPGTSIQLNFYQLCLLVILVVWLLYRQHYRLVLAKTHELSKKYRLIDHLRAIIIWTFIKFQKFSS
ncbi:hypothetical protein A3F65_01145 [Candidatus Saccharibacteria bacterium RIFCSPHIGHO2_12_FULL_47_16b]|nr:MAG: hypothetical protein A3F65_01145 [Candidatus Saccharibacteria bacterium RIFCSPHIGHO2_12_FULL_47_16b]OGL38833.1 MAG: hypothetical protein A3J32_00820 [Candidatus Saccharibacteria bacterium RIFCSPLOWO2_02_FULL_46_7]